MCRAETILGMNRLCGCLIAPSAGGTLGCRMARFVGVFVTYVPAYSTCLGVGVFHGMFLVRRYSAAVPDVVVNNAHRSTHPSYCSCLSHNAGLPARNVSLAAAVRAIQQPSISAISAADLQLQRNDVLGRGGNGVVYGAKWNSTRVAVKVLRDALSRPSDFSILDREARILAAVRHPNILGFYGVCRMTDGQLGVVMERADTDVERLAARLRDAPASERAAYAVHIGAAVARALHHLHTSFSDRQRVVHHDVKPSNVLLVLPSAMVCEL